MRLEYLIKDINDEMLKKIQASRPMEEKEAEATAKIVGLSALKYGDLSNQASKDYIFDVDRLLPRREIRGLISCIRSCVSNPS